jgi:hypothetical protein
VGSREDPGDRGRRRGQRLLGDALADFHTARLERSISQRQIGTSIGRSDAWVGWTESGQNLGLSVVQLAQLLECVGLQLGMRAYPAGGALRDQAQLDLLARFKALIEPRWSWASEVPIPIAGDMRAWDAVIHGTTTIAIEAETRIRDYQALDRRVMLKLRDSGLERVIILVPATRTNRGVLHELAQSTSNYPIPSSPALNALIAGRDPGGNAIIMLDSRRTRS